MKKLYLLALCGLFTACATTSKISKEELKVSFLDEFVLPADQSFEATKIGGLSGIDYGNDQYYLICDQASNPRFYSAKIKLKGNEIDTVLITGVTRISKDQDFVRNTLLDMESIRYLPENKNFIISSEGSIQNNTDPAVFKVDENGNFINKLSLPDYFKASGEQKPRNNGVFEGLAIGNEGNGYWVATELPLEKDGAKPKLWPTHSPSRITYFDAKTGLPIRQFAYELDGISKLPINYFAVNGLTEILEYEKDKFLVLERAYSAGYGSRGNTVKIFNVDASKATNTLQMDNLRKEKYQAAEKSLVFNFKSIRKQLTDKIIDNIEGMTFGPVLPNGNPSLILVSDNNFNSFGKQLNQFILLEIDFKN